MTEIPEHLRTRAEAARRKVEGAPEPPDPEPTAEAIAEFPEHQVSSERLAAELMRRLKSAEQGLCPYCSTDWGDPGHRCSKRLRPEWWPPATLATIHRLRHDLQGVADPPPERDWREDLADLLDALAAQLR